MPESLLLSDNKLKSTLDNFNANHSRKTEKFYRVVMENSSQRKISLRPFEKGTSENLRLSATHQRRNRTGNRKFRINKDIDFKMSKRKNKSAFYNAIGNSKHEGKQPLNEDQVLNIQTNNFFNNEDNRADSNISPLIGSIANSIMENAIGNIHLQSGVESAKISKSDSPLKKVNFDPDSVKSNFGSNNVDL